MLSGQCVIEDCEATVLRGIPLEAVVSAHPHAGDKRRCVRYNQRELYPRARLNGVDDFALADMVGHGHRLHITGNRVMRNRQDLMRTVNRDNQTGDLILPVGGPCTTAKVSNGIAELIMYFTRFFGGSSKGGSNVAVAAVRFQGIFLRSARWKVGR